MSGQGQLPAEQDEQDRKLIAKVENTKDQNIGRQRDGNWECVFLTCVTLLLDQMHFMYHVFIYNLIHSAMSKLKPSNGNISPYSETNSHLVHHMKMKLWSS